MAEPSTSEETRTDGSEEGKPPRKINWIVVGAGVGLAAFAVAAVFFAFRFVEDQRARETRVWQVRLGIVADSRAAAVNQWVEQNFATLRELAENASLQLYMTELEIAEGDQDAVTDEAAQATYLRNLLIATADRTGFKPPPAAGEIAANVERPGVAGLGLTNKDGLPIVSTAEMPPFTGKIRTAVAKALDGEPTIIDIYMGPTNLPTMGFALPLFGLQEDEGAQGIGAVVGVRTIGADLFDRLKQPGELAQTAETYLTRKSDSGAEVEYLSPLANSPLTKFLLDAERAV